MKACCFSLFKTLSHSQMGEPISLKSHLYMHHLAHDSWFIMSLHPVKWQNGSYSKTMSPSLQHVQLSLVKQTKQKQNRKKGPERTSSKSSLTQMPTKVSLHHKCGTEQIKCFEFKLKVNFTNVLMIWRTKQKTVLKRQLHHVHGLQTPAGASARSYNEYLMWQTTNVVEG